MSLTETEIKKIRPGPKPFVVKDMAGLVLDVRPTGRKVFVKAYRFHGKQRKDTLGEFPALTRWFSALGLSTQRYPVLVGKRALPPARRR